MNKRKRKRERERATIENFIPKIFIMNKKKNDLRIYSRDRNYLVKINPHFLIDSNNRRYSFDRFDIIFSSYINI